jgi:hypothetical protein
LLYASQVVARGPSWWARGPVDAGFTQGVAISRSQAVNIVEATDGDSAGSNTVTLARATSGDDRQVIIRGEPCTEGAQGELFPILHIESKKRSYWLRRTSPEAYAVSGMSTPDPGAQSARIHRFEIIPGTLTREPD